MRSSISPFAASAVLAIAILVSAGARAETPAEPPVTCAALTVAAPAQLIESCTALIDNPATPDADRLDAMITRAVAHHGGAEGDKALARAHPLMSKNPNRPRRLPAAVE